MKCNQCGGKYETKHDDLELTDEYVGPFTVKAVEYLACSGCGDVAYPPETITEIEKSRSLALEEMLRSLPLGDFVSSTTAANMLGISRQALHKHRRIRRGFIFETKFDDKKAYLKESVERFRQTGDGRFPLLGTEKENNHNPKREMAVVVVRYKEPRIWGPSYFYKGLGQTVK